jgi:hypothetical protein
MERGYRVPSKGQRLGGEEWLGLMLPNLDKTSGLSDTTVVRGYAMQEAMRRYQYQR